MKLTVLEPDYECVCSLMIGSRSLWDLVVQYQKGADRLRLPRQGGKALGTKAAGLLVKNLNSLRPKLMKAVAMYNNEAKKYAGLLADSQRFHPILSTQSAPPSAPEGFNELLKLDILAPLWNHGLFSHPTEPWAYDEDVRVGIPSVLSHARCEQEIKQLGWEVRRIGQWLISRHRKLQQARQQLHQQNKVDDSAITILEQEEEHINTTAHQWFSRGGLDYLWQRTRDTGKLQVDGWVELWVWCTDDAELFQQTTADELPDLTSFAGSPGNRINKMDDNTDEEVDFGISDHYSDNLSNHSIDAMDYGAFRPGEWDFNAENNDSDDETW